MTKGLFTYTLGILLCFQFNFTFAQQPLQKDSLQRVLRSTVNDTVKMQVYVTLINHYTYNNTDTAVALCRDLIELAEKSNRIDFVAIGHKSLGNQHYVQANFANAMDEYLIALRLMEENGMSNKTAGILHNIGNIQIRWKHPKKALTYLNKARRLNEKNGNSSWLNNNYQAIGVVYADLLNNTDSALYYQKRAFKLCKINNFQSALLAANLNIGSSFLKMQEYDSAKVYFNNALAIGIENDYTMNQGEIYEKLGIMAYYEKDYTSAEAFYNKAIAAYTVLERSEDLIGVYRNAASNYYDMGLFKRAYELASEASLIRDSVFSINEKNKLAQLEADYKLLSTSKELELAKKDAVIAAQNLERESLRARVWVSIAFAGFAIALLIFILYRNNRKNLRTIATKSAEIEKANELITKANAQLNDLIEEKNNILNTVAHDFRSPLTKINALVDLMNLDETLNEKANIKLERIKANVLASDRLIQDLVEVQREEQLHKQLQPVSISPLAEMHNIAAHLQEIASSKNIAINIYGDDTLFYTDPYRLHRLLENLVSNAIKFSPENKKVTLSCVVERELCTLGIADEGPGFSAADKQLMFKSFQKLSAKPIGGGKSTGLGLAIVKRMVDELNGTLHLDSEKGKGANFTITLPTLS